MGKYEILRIPSLVESGYEVVDTATMSLTQRMIACLNNDKMADVHLVGDDGIKVNACKFVLGCASPNLQTLLYQGKEKSHVNIPNCRAKTLKALVEFSCSDMLNTIIWADTEPVEIVEDMIALAKLGHQYGLPNLKQQVSDVLSPCLEQLPSLACVAYNLADPKTTAELNEAALEVLRKKPYQAFVRAPGGDIGGVACLSPEKLDMIYRDDEVIAEEIFLFRCLQDWKAHNEGSYANVDQICSMVAQNLDFSAMSASDLEDIVLPSGLVDAGSLVVGLMTVAKAAEKRGISLPSTRRKYLKPARTDSSITSGGRRGRRFKKPEPERSIAEDLSMLSSALPSASEETRDDSPAIISIVKTPIPETTTVTSKKTRTLGFKPNRFRVASRATRLWGVLRPSNYPKENISDSESECDGAPLPRTPTGSEIKDRKSGDEKSMVGVEESKKLKELKPLEEVESSIKEGLERESKETELKEVQDRIIEIVTE